MSKPQNTNFTILSPFPIDSRMAVKNYIDLDAIPIKYNHMVSHVESTDKDYKYYSATNTWVEVTYNTSVSWGDIIGDINDQADLIAKFDDYALVGHTHSQLPPLDHTHAEVDITDLDKYTQEEVDILIRMQNSYATGLLVGGVLTSGTGETFTIPTGIGIKSEWSISEPFTPPIVSEVIFGPYTDITPAYMATSPTTYIGIDYDSNTEVSTVVQKATPFSSTARRNIILLGIIHHPDNTTIESIEPVSAPTINTVNQLHDTLGAIGVINTSGNVYSPNGANLNINKSEGTIFKRGIAVNTTPLSPHEKTISLGTALTLNYRFLNDTQLTSATTINPDIKDLSGVSTPVNSGKWTIQRIYLDSRGSTIIQPGQNEYDTKSEAIAVLQAEEFTVSPYNKIESVLRAYLVVQEGATNLNDKNQAEFFSVHKFGWVQQALDSSTPPPTFIGQTDTPVSYAGAANTFVMVNGATNALEFVPEVTWASNTFTVGNINGVFTLRNLTGYSELYASNRFDFETNEGVRLNDIGKTSYTDFIVTSGSSAQLNTGLVSGTILTTTGDASGLTGLPTPSDDAYGPSWDNNLDAATKNAIYDALEALPTGVSDHTLLTNIGTNTHAQIDSHIGDSSIHFTQASISITESQISDLQSYLLSSDINTLAKVNVIITDATLIDTGDPRLSDARTPLAHSHVIADISDFTDNSTNWDTAFGWGDHSGLYVDLISAQNIAGVKTFDNDVYVGDSGGAHIRIVESLGFINSEDVTGNWASIRPTGFLLHVNASSRTVTIAPPGTLSNNYTQSLQNKAGTFAYLGENISEFTNDAGYISSATGDWIGTFDGQEGTYYLDYNNFTNTPTIPTTLIELTDVNTATPTNKNVLIADGVDWESRALVESDISDFGSYMLASQQLAQTKAGISGEFFTSYDSSTGLFTSSPVSYNDLSDVPLTFSPSTHTLLGHTISGETLGHVLAADSATTYSIRQLLGSEINNNLGWTTNVGDVIKVGTPVNNQIGVWTGDGTLEGDPKLIFNAGSSLLGVGIDDNTGGILYLYGNGTGVSSGATLRLYNAADHRTTQAAYEWKSVNGDLVLRGVSGGEYIRAFASGGLKFDDYGVGAVTGTDAYLLAVDSSGNVVERALNVDSADNLGNHIAEQDLDMAGYKIISSTNDVNIDVSSDFRAGDWSGVNHGLTIQIVDATDYVFVGQANGTRLVLNKDGAAQLVGTSALFLESDANAIIVIDEDNNTTGTASFLVQADSPRIDLLKIIENGSVEAPSITNALIDSIGAKSLVSREWVLANTGSSPLTTKGDLYTYDTADTRLPIGTNGQVLTADSAEAAGMKWATPASGVTDHTLLTNIGTNTHAQIDTHIADATTHFTQASISITESQISDLQAYGFGDVTKTGTPLDNQIAVFTDSDTIEGTVGLTWDGTTLDVNGKIEHTGIIQSSGGDVEVYSDGGTTFLSRLVDDTGWVDTVPTTFFQVGLGATNGNIIFNGRFAQTPPRTLHMSSGFQISNSATYTAIPAPTGIFEVLDNNTVVFKISNTGLVTIANSLTVIGSITGTNLSGTNTGDQTSIVGITGTKAQFDTAVTDDNFAYQSDLHTKPILRAATTIKSPEVGDDVPLFFTPVAITITNSNSYIRGATSVTYNIKHALTANDDGSNVFSSDIVENSITGSSHTTGFIDATIPANSYVWLDVTGVSGTPSWFSLTLIYEED